MIKLARSVPIYVFITAENLKKRKRVNIDRNNKYRLFVGPTPR